jgi:septal ring factor EnvC (AmiA/AmiB activator)
MRFMIRASHGFAVLACSVAFLATATAEQAQKPPVAPAGPKEIERTERQREFDALLGDLQRSRGQEAKLKGEIDKIKDDRKKFSQDLLDTAGRIRAAEAKLSDAEKRLAPLDQREAELKKSLSGREAILSQVLAALERLGLHPAPALLLQPETTLEAVRSAILLGAVVPELRGQAESIVADLSELARLRRDIALERDSLTANRAALAEDQRRISALIDERQRQQGEDEKALEGERGRVQALAKQVETVQDLVSRMEREIEAASRAAETAKREEPVKSASLAPPDSARISPAVPFQEAKGKLSFPAIGRKLHEYGATNGLGGVEKGLSLATRPDAQVSAPCDGWVVYAGNFRNYGQLLIINAGGGYHILLAGMERITVDLGQFVLTGEPVAVMGSASRVAAVSAFGSSEAILYVEFRKDGNSIDPSPWWATTEDEKVRG